MTLEKLRQMIREMIKQHLDEISTSAEAGHYDTPFAFQGKNNKKRRYLAHLLGFQLVNLDDEKPESLEEARYTHFRDDVSRTPRQKIGVSIREINQQLHALDELLSMVVRLKAEHNLGTDTLWKRTNKAFVRLEQKMHRIAVKLRKLKE